jgi:hypothetical protein
VKKNSHKWELFPREIQRPWQLEQGVNDVGIRNNQAVIQNHTRSDYRKHLSSLFRSAALNY